MPRPESLNPEKARRAAKHPERTGENCAAEPGTYRVTIDRNKCEGKADCVEVCPYNVFEVRRIDAADYTQLSLVGKLKSRVHGRKTAYTPRMAACQACGMCVVACPEQAISLVLALTLR
jgi:NAD-dependent dihydropyrimidine dehydrogenase PreA subunit